jgi:hypothetical protein
VLVGMGGDEHLLPLSVIQERELELTGTFRYAGTWPRAIALIASGRINLDRLVTGTYRLDQTEEALTASRRDQQSVKVVVHPQTTGPPLSLTQGDSMASVTYDKASRIYPGAERPAVDALDLDITDGEFLILVGLWRH